METVLWHGVVKFINMALEIKVLKNGQDNGKLKKKHSCVAREIINKIRSPIYQENSHKSYVKRS